MLLRVVRPAVLMRFEGASALAAGVTVYWALEGPWWVFAAAFFAPDLALLGFLRGKRMGVVLYNAAHTYALPVLVGAGAVLTASRPAALAALIWLAHIGTDRLVGFGLKT